MKGSLFQPATGPAEGPFWVAQNGATRLRVPGRSDRLKAFVAEQGVILPSQAFVRGEVVGDEHFESEDSGLVSFRSLGQWTVLVELLDGDCDGSNQDFTSPHSFDPAKPITICEGNRITSRTYTATAPNQIHFTTPPDDGVILSICYLHPNT